MSTFARNRRFVTLLVAAAASFAALAAAPASHAYDPWSAVPAFPTALYSSQDQFKTTVETALATVNAETEKQRDINGKLSAQGNKQAEQMAEQDPYAMAQKMQEQMMQNPQAMQAMMHPEAIQEQAAHANASDQEMKVADEKIVKDYEAALKAAMEPYRARFRALSKKAAPYVTKGEGGDEWPAWASKEGDAIMADAHRGYEVLAAKWFAPGGQVPTFLQRRRTYLVNEAIPYREQHFDAPSAGLYGPSFRSLAPYEAVQNYLKLAEKLYDMRTAGTRSCMTSSACSDALQVAVAD
jgi:hypothetical protein